MASTSPSRANFLGTHAPSNSGWPRCRRACHVEPLLIGFLSYGTDIPIAKTRRFGNKREFASVLLVRKERAEIVGELLPTLLKLIEPDRV
jgi:hypothetical protein